MRCRSSRARTPRPSSCAGTSSTPWQRRPAPARSGRGPTASRGSASRYTSHMWRGPGSKARSVLEVAFAVPGDIDAPTGGYAYARKLSALAPGFGVNLTHIRLPGGFPHPSPEELAETERLLSASRRPLHLVDGLAYGALPAALVRRLPGATIALVHHPLAFESGLAPERRDALLCSEREALAEAKHVIASSRFTARPLAADFDVPPDRLSIAQPRTQPAPRALGTRPPGRAPSPRPG